MKKKILSILLALVMVFSLIPTTMWAEEGNVAKIGDMEYATLADAIAAANDGDTVTLLADVELEDSIDVTGEVTLDLNGHTISAAEGATASNKFTANSAHDYLIGVKYNAVLEVVDHAGGGAVDGSDLLVGIKLTTKGEVFDEDSASLVIGEGEEDNNFTITGGTYGISGNGTRHYTSLEVNGGTIEGKACTGIYQPQDGYLTIYGGTIKGHDSAVEVRAGGDLSDDSSEVQFWGGTYVVTGADEYSVAKNGSGTSVKGAAIAISQHTTKKDIDVYVDVDPEESAFNWVINEGQVRFAVANPEGNAFDNVKILVASKADSFGDSYELPEGFHWYPAGDADNEDFVELLQSVAEVLDSNNEHKAYYASLADAIAAVPTDGTETTIVMLADEELSSGVTVAANQNIVLDLNGFTVSESLSQSGTTALITNRGTLTIKDSTDTNADGTGTGKITYFNGLPDPAAIPGYASNAICNNGALTIESGLIENRTNGGYAAYTVDNITNGGLYTPVFTMNGGRLYNNYTDAVRMFLNSTSNLNKVVINGGVLDSDKASGRVIVVHNPNSKVNKGELDITGGIINGKINAWSAANAGGVEDRFSDEQYAEISINISGGKIRKLSFTEMANETLRAQALRVTGGKYVVDPSAYVTEGYEAVTNTDDDAAAYPYVIGEAVNYVAQIGDVKYETLEAAIAAAQDGETVKVLADCAGNGIKVPQGKFTAGLTVNFDGHTYTMDGAMVGSTGTETQAFQLLKDNKITFQNGTITSTKAKILVQNYSDLTLEGMTLTLNNPNYASAYTLSNNNGEIVIDNTTINANPAGGFAFDVCRYASYPSVHVTVQGASVINGDVEISASKSDAKDGFGLTLTSGTLNGNIVLDGTAKAALENDPTKASVTKADAFTQTAPAGYKWNANGDGTSSLVKVNYVAQIGDVKYATLAAAIAAANEMDSATVTLLRDYDMETNEPGYGWTTLSHSAREKFLEISGTGLTFDLNGYTLSEVFNNTFKVTGENVTIKNGEMRVANYTNGDSGSYVIMADGATNLTIDELTTYGGINIAGGSTATINDLAFSGTLFYAVCSQEGSTVTLNGGTYNKAIAGSTRKLFWIEAGSTMNITGGTFNIEGNSANFLNGKVKPVITGGTFDFDPTTKGVADGYEAVETVANTTWQVGEVKANDLSASENTTEGYDATYTAIRQVVDSDNTVIADAETSVTVNIKVVTDGANTASADAALGKVQIQEVLDSVMAATEVNDDDIVNIDIEVVRTQKDTSASSITYEVHPEAKVSVNGGAPQTVQIGNEDLAENASFTITLPVPDELVNATGQVKVTHKSEDRADEVSAYPVQGTPGNYYVTFTVTHFSEFELSAIDEVLQDATANVDATLSLADEILINLYVSNLKTALGTAEPDPSRFTVEYTFNGGATQTVSMTSATSNHLVIARCAASQLADEVNIKLFYDNNLLFETDYSAQQYCMNQINNSNDNKLVELCHALLAYGSRAQLYFDYNTGDLADALDNYYIPYSYIPEDYYLSMSADGVNDVIMNYGLNASLSLKANTQINVYFQPYSGDDYKVYVNDTEVTWSYNTEGWIYIAIPGIASKQLADQVKITIERVSVGGEYTFYYSPMNWAYRMYYAGYSTYSIAHEYEQQLCIALYNYYKAADAYFPDSSNS